MNRKLMPSPAQIETMRVFLAECTGLHIDHMLFTRPASGIAMIIHYRDKGGHSHKKTIQNPNANSWSEIEDLVVLASEWLIHAVTQQMDALSAVVH
jgi:hypothetical protein